jgi:hypothetical protein
MNKAYKEYIYCETKRNTAGWKSWTRFECICKGNNMSKVTKNVVHPDKCFVPKDDYYSRKPTKKEIFKYTLQFIKLKINYIVRIIKK